MRSLSLPNTSLSSSSFGIGDTLRDDNLDERELVLGFFDTPKVDTALFDSLSDEPDPDLVAMEDDVDGEGFLFFASGFSDLEDSFCFLFVGGL